MDPTPRPWAMRGATKSSNFGNWQARITATDPHGPVTVAKVNSGNGADFDTEEVATANAALIVAAVNSYDTHKALVEAALLVLGCHPVGSEFAQFDALEKLRQALKAIDLKAVEETDK